ncbi:Uncharacterised protein [BD1-7 clade bacterium]|uniref:Baseplate protein J-like domain-containing protein n=1 Tax=BD1-7 clade bacterium TaxID=2029982 RepID=A0A5S9Q3R8_9GAMM|nr:Uncharacterised protein [BD1-7 clade bacterium]CAA0111772.1 Uncharacterised protein [BD1-7 clade bacterium]
MSIRDNDLHLMPRPAVIETISFEQILEEQKAQLNGLQPMLFTPDKQPVMREAELVVAQNGERYFKVPVVDDAGLLYLELESETHVKQLQVSSYREMLLRQRVNEGAFATMLAYANGKDLDNVVARYGVKRETLDPGDPTATPPIDPTYESDPSLRRRGQLAYEALSTAGPEGAYEFHALSASAQVKDVDIDAPRFAVLDLDPALLAQLPDDAIVLQCIHDAGLNKPAPGDVAVTVLSHSGNGNPDETTINAVDGRLNKKTVRPMTDNPRVRAAGIAEYSVTASLIIYSGPDAALILETAKAALAAYVAQQHSLKLAPTVAGIYEALKQPGVHDVIFNENSIPSLEKYQAAYCTAMNVTIGGTYDR